MGRAKVYQINGAELTRAIKQRCLAKEDMSEAMGYDKQFLWKCIYNNQISVTASKLMDLMYDIPIDEYSALKVKSPPVYAKARLYDEIREEIVTEVNETVGSMVQEIVREALKDAMQSALERMMR